MDSQLAKPVLIELGATVTVEDPITAEVRQIGVHERIGAWTLMAVIDLDLLGRVAVFEDFTSGTGSLIFLNRDGLLLELTKRLESTSVPSTGCYRGHTKVEVVDGAEDLLLRELLALGRDPSYEEVASCFPPIRRVRYCGRYEGPHTFVGSPKSADIVPFYYNPLEGAARVNPLVIAPQIRAAIEAEQLSEGLVGGWLPAIHISYPTGDGAAWDLVMFGVAEPPSQFIQPVWYRFLKLEGGEIKEAHYVDSYLPYPWSEEPGGEGFYRELYRLKAYWAERFESAMRLELPRAWMADFCRHAMAQEMITRVGAHPKYGVVDRDYGSYEHDGFQDTINASVTCCLEWGLFDVSRGYLDYYLTHFMGANGSIAYRGPEMGQYARMLTVLAQYCAYTGDSELILKHDQKIRSVVEMLLVRRQNAQKRRAEDPAYGMIPGRHEADISFEVPDLAALDFEQPYFSNSAEAWRGFRDLGRTWVEMAAQSGDKELLRRGKRLVEEAEALRGDIDRAIERSILDDSGTPYLPPIAGSKIRHIDAPYRSRPESFDANRVWCEMMHSGVITRDTVELILDHASLHYGTTLGIFGNRSRVVAFQCYGEAYGLIQHDMIREFLVFYYAHMSHLHTRGTWSVFECVDMDRDRAQHLPYCAPAQVTIPIVTKWMLVFEDPLTDSLWLAKAIPRDWLTDGGRIGVEGAPTRWGSISFEIESHLQEGEVRARIWPPERKPSAVCLRVRVPESHTMHRVEVNGEAWDEIQPDGETITVPVHGPAPIQVTAWYRPAGGD